MTDRCDSGHCVTCGDVAEEVRVLDVDPARELALCAGPDGRRLTVQTALVDAVAPGDRMLVHAGTAIARVASGDRV